MIRYASLVDKRILGNSAFIQKTFLLPSPMNSLSLYLHIPFCRHRCAYCDFNTYTSLFELHEAYAQALVQEIKQVAGAERRPAHTIFFGGGTPSLMPSHTLEWILTAVRQHFTLSPTAEITLEANPGTVDAAYLAALRALGVNRLSFGVQSAVASELVLLEREHNFATVIEAVHLARTAGFANLNLDLIYGVPGQTLASWETSLQAALSLQPTHISLYCLTIEPGTPMERWLRNGRIQPPDPDLAADQYERAGEQMAAAGLQQYEISNWALPGHECQHNLTYWRNGEYLGFGAGAHGHAAGYRYEVVKQPRVYIRRMQNPQPQPYPLSSAIAEKHPIGRSEAMSDTVITQLRLLQEGLDLITFTNKFGESFDTVYPGVVEQLTDWGLVAVENSHLKLTQNGRFLSNQVFYRFV